MLEGIFGNKTAEKVLLHIFHYGESHASAIAQDFEIVVLPGFQDTFSEIFWTLLS